MKAYLFTARPTHSTQHVSIVSGLARDSLAYSFMLDVYPESLRHPHKQIHLCPLRPCNYFDARPLLLATMCQQRHPSTQAAV